MTAETRDGMDDLERMPVSDVATLRTLDERDILSGYYAGLAGRDEPGVEFNRAYWHGWRNGMRDNGRIPGDSAMAKLAADVINTGYLRECVAKMKGGA